MADDQDATWSYDVETVGTDAVLATDTINSTYTWWRAQPAGTQDSTGAITLEMLERAVQMYTSRPGVRYASWDDLTAAPKGPACWDVSEGL